MSEPCILIVGHTPTDAMAELAACLRNGVLDPSIGGIQLAERAALEATDLDVMAADGVILLTPANFGYMSGALKHFFDSIFRTCESETVRTPVALVVHGESDGTGAVESVRRICAALEWRFVAEPVVVLGPVGAPDRDAVHEVAATMAALLATGMV